ncbi:MAG: histidine kinase [Rubrobacteraceae bacterium]
MKSSIFSLRRLRWKLTLSYTLVTVVALLALELILVSALVAFAYSPAPPYLISQWAASNIAPRLEPHLAQKKPDIKGLRSALQKSIGADNRPTNGDPASGNLLVLGPDRKLLVAEPNLDRFQTGERFQAGRFPGLKPLLAKALDGKGDPGPLSASAPGRWMFAAVPIRDDGGKVVGLLVGTLQLPNPTGPLLIATGVSAVALMVPAAILGTIFGFLTAWSLARRLGRLALAARSWSRGDFSVSVEDRSKDELGQLSRELNTMAGQLEHLIQTRQELATLEARNRFARDLHDSVKQQVFATSLQVAAARALINRDTEAAETHLVQADELVRQAQKELNVLIHEMRPAALEGQGLAPALREYAARWSQGSEIPTEVNVRGEREAPLEVEQTIFRIAQEALANVAKHSGAKKAELDLLYDASTVTLLVTDDGRGFDPAGTSGEGFGMKSMQDRATSLGGNVEIQSKPDEGTRVVCICPLDGATDRKDGRA